MTINKLTFSMLLNKLIKLNIRINKKIKNASREVRTKHLEHKAVSKCCLMICQFHF